MKFVSIQTKKKIQYTTAGVVLLSISFLQLFGVTTSIATRFSGDIAAQITKPALAPKITVSDTKNETYVPLYITMSTAHISLPVVSVPLTQGTWVVHNGVANYAVETSKVNEKTGNVGLFGHDRANAFTRIKLLKTGDPIQVSGGGFVASYKVSSSQVIDPTRVETFYPTAKPTLTLVTCDGVFSQQRYAVKADLVNIKHTK